MIVEEGELNTEHYRSVLSWLEAPIPQVVSRRPSHYLPPPIPSTVPQKTEFITVDEFRKFEDRVENDLHEIRGRLQSLDSRVRKLEEGYVNPVKLEVDIVKRLKNSADFHFQLSVHRLAKELREELNLPPKNVESPKIYTMSDDEETGAMPQFKPSFKEGDYMPDFLEYDQSSQDVVLSVLPKSYILPKSELTTEEEVIVEKAGDEEAGDEEAAFEKAGGDEDVEKSVNDVVVEKMEVENVVVGKKKRSRIQRDRKLGPAAKSPFIDPTKKKQKVTDVVVDVVVEELVEPHPKPVDDHKCSKEKEKMIGQWLKRLEKVKKWG